MNTKLPKYYADSYSPDKRRRRRQHRIAARNLERDNVGVFGPSLIIHSVARWHRQQARWL